MSWVTVKETMMTGTSTDETRTPEKRRSGMNRTREVIALGLTLVVGLSAGCDTKSLTEINQNPNAPETVDAQYLMPALVQVSVNTILGQRSVSMDWASPWVQHYASLDYGYDDRYEMGADFADGRWNTLWLGPVIDIQEVVEQGRETGRPNVEAVGLIYKSWLFHVMTDIWGDLPYSQAAQGIEGPIAPLYDSQANIYDGLIGDLKAAQDMIGTSGSLFTNPSFDILYEGDLEGWRRFANSVRLRAGMRLSDIDPTKAASVVASAVSDGVIEDASQAATLNYPGAPPNEQPWSEYFRERPNDYRASITMTDSLKSTNDPRIAVVYQTAFESGEYVGKDNGTPDTHGLAFESLSRMGLWYQEADRPTWLITLEEVLFLKAEAAARGWISGDPAEFYHDGIRAAMTRIDVAEADIDAYLAQPRIQYDPASWSEQIAFQKWIALYDNGMEAWANYRRTDTPAFVPGPAAVEPRVPLRAPYPANEEDLNKANLAEAIARQGGDSPTSPLWWDVN